MKRLISVVSVFSMVAGLFLTMGCAAMLRPVTSMSSGTKLSPDQIAAVKAGKGVMTQAQAQGILGPPMRIQGIGDGRLMLLYAFTSTSAQQKVSMPFTSRAEGDMEMQSVQVNIRNGLVDDVIDSDSVQHTTRKMGALGGMTMTTTPVSVSDAGGPTGTNGLAGISPSQ